MKGNNECALYQIAASLFALFVQPRAFALLHHPLRFTSVGFPLMKPTILLGEDDPGDALLLELALGKALEDVALRSVRDGQEVLDYLQGRGHFADRERFPVPGIIILDLKLPVLDGFEVIAWVRAQAEFMQLPIIVLTGSDDPADMKRALDLGANCCCLKPSSPDDLRELVKELGENCGDLIQR